MKFPNFMFYGRQKQTTSIFVFFSKVGYGPSLPWPSPSPSSSGLRKLPLSSDEREGNENVLGF